MSVYAKDYGYFFNSQNNDRTYNADSFETWMKPFFAPGVFQGSLQVTAQATPDLTVNVASGFAFLNGKPAYWATANTMNIDTPSGAYDRIDTIVLRRDDTNRCITLEVVKGTPSATPAATPPTRSATIYELVIAQILVGVGVTGIRAEDITDTRMDSSVCGYVAGAVDQIDFDQIATQFNGWMADYQQDFEDWFANIQGQLDQDAAGHLQNEIDALTSTVSGKVNKSGDIMTGILRVKYSNIDMINPSGVDRHGDAIRLMDSNAAPFGHIGARQDSDGTIGLELLVNNKNSQEDSLKYKIKTTGEPVVEMTTPSVWRGALGLLEGIEHLAHKQTTIAANASKTFTFTETGPFLFFCTQNSDNGCGGFMVRGVSGGTCYTGKFGGMTNLTMTKASGKVTIANGAGATVYVDIISLNGASMPTY